MDKLSTESYKGVRDFYPEDEAVQKYIFATMRQFVEKCGYVEYNASVLEPAELYRAKNAENVEIVNEQTYTFVDRGDREVTLRPEMTPTVARMVAARRRELPFPLRWYCVQNFFRYERPQRGRVREFWQLNVDIFGTRSLNADIEVVAMAYGLMRAFGATEQDFEIRLGSRMYLDRLCAEFGLEGDRKNEFLKLLDRKHKMPAAEFAGEMRRFDIPENRLTPDEVPEDVAAVLKPLQDSGFGNILYDPSVVRGFAYYTGVVFEVFDTHPENNRALFGGGRYDNLLEKFLPAQAGGGDQLPATGFAAGDVTIHDFLSVRGLLPPYLSTTKVYIAVTGPELAPEAQRLAGELRVQNINTAIDFGDKKLGDQLKAADKLKIPYVIVMGADELASGEFPVRDMQTREEKKLSRSELAPFFLGLS